MRVPRRALLAATAALAAGPARAAPVEVKARPGAAPSAIRLQTQPERTRLQLGGFREAIILPGEAQPLAVLPIAGRELLEMQVDAGAMAGVSQSLAVLVGFDGTRLRVMDVETLAFEADSLNGRKARMDAHLAALPDRRHLRLSVDASQTGPKQSPRRESWADLLAWHEGGPLVPADPRPAQAGTLQAHMAEARRRVLHLLAKPRTEVTLDMLGPTGLLDPFGAA